MKKLLAGFLSVFLALTISGCSLQGKPDQTPTHPDANNHEFTGDTHSEIPKNGNTGKSMHALALPTVKEEVCSDDGTLLFTLSFQNASVDLGNNKIAELVTGDLQSRTDGILSDADHICENAMNDQPEHPDWTPYFLDVSYTPTRLDQVLLSLCCNQVSYSGGAHPFVYTDSVTYDLQTGSPLQLVDIFKDNFGNDVLCALVLKALEPKSAELSYHYQETVTQQFTSGDEMKDDWYFSRNGLCFHFSPYEIAPYSVGTVIAEIPYSELSGILLEQYFPSMTENTTGSMYAEAYTEETAQRFQRITDIRLNEKSTPILLYPDATVTDLRIEIGTHLEGDPKFIATSVVFAADTISIGEAIRVFAAPSQEDTLLRLVYHSNNREVSSLISSDITTGNIVLSGE